MKSFNIVDYFRENPEFHGPLHRILAEFLSSRLENPLSEEQARLLITQGSLWSGPHRCKDPELDCRQLSQEQRLNLHLYYPQLPIFPFVFDAQDLIYEDEYFVLVYKKSGVNTCPSIFSDEDCLSAGVQAFMDNREIQKGNPVSSYRINTINRLDRATSGLVFFAKSADSEAALHALFRLRKIQKRYLAATPVFEGAKTCYKVRDTLMVKGKLKDASSLIVRTPSEEKDGLEPLLFWTILPQTGRTHQIRIHFQRYLRPIVGDCAYGGGLYTADQTLSLCCVGYRFTHPFTGQKMRFYHWKERF